MTATPTRVPLILGNPQMYQAQESPGRCRRFLRRLAFLTASRRTFQASQLQGLEKTHCACSKLAFEFVTLNHVPYVLPKGTKMCTERGGVRILLAKMTVGAHIVRRVYRTSMEITRTLRLQVPNNHILTPNQYYNFYYPKPTYLIIGYMDLWDSLVQ